jgi:hypothetical protein
MRRFRPSPAMLVACVALFVALGGSAVALSGHNTVQSDDLGPGAQVKAPDVAHNAVDSAGIKNGQVSVKDANKVIPSGATITGAFRESEDNEAGAGANLQFGVDFYGLRAPKALTDADIVFDNEGISAAAALNDEEDPACTGGIGIPTAPPGKVCVYLFYEQVRNNSATANPLGFGTGFDQADDKGFFVSAQENNGLARLGGTWAYHAP